jgi:hypothetical protein
MKGADIPHSLGELPNMEPEMYHSPVDLSSRTWHPFNEQPTKEPQKSEQQPALHSEVQIPNLNTGVSALGWDWRWLTTRILVHRISNYQYGRPKMETYSIQVYVLDV